MNTVIVVGFQYISTLSGGLLIIIIRYFAECVFVLVPWLVRPVTDN